ncbi:MAG: hypothetical protein JW880_00220 [Candidatus Thermoplasmatota archaeon]|nr:hypothetical protein [Candidatus Thermoplasmatota archaeon]
MTGPSVPLESRKGAIDARSLLTDEERAKMLARIHSLVYWVGMLIPEHELLGGSGIDLREVVYNLTTKEHLTDDEVDEIHKLIDLLKAKERSLERTLAHDPMATGTAKELLAEICGLLRAIDELRSTESQEHAEFSAQEVMKRVGDAKRWQRFLEAIKPPT